MFHTKNEYHTIFNHQRHVIQTSKKILHEFSLRLFLVFAPASRVDGALLVGRGTQIAY
jgi:hypothetical protein